MPFKSEAQRKWMWAEHPEMAKRWQKHTPKGKRLPEHVKKKAHILEGIEKESLSFALGERPDEANGYLNEPTFTNGGKPSYGMDAMSSLDAYRPSYSISDGNNNEKNRIKLKTAGSAGDIHNHPDTYKNTTPPNLREGMMDTSCNTCKNFDSLNSECNKYNYQVRADQVCDDFEHKENSMPGQEDRQSFREQSSPIGVTSPYSDSLSPEQAFKFGFYLGCAEDGITIEDLEKGMEKKANPGLLTGAGAILGGGGLLASGVTQAANAASSYLPMAAGLGIGIPTLAGIGLAHAHHRVRRSQADEWKNNNQVDINDFKDMELAEAYHQAAREAGLRNQLIRHQQTAQEKSAPRLGGPRDLKRPDDHLLF